MARFTTTLGAAALALGSLAALPALAQTSPATPAPASSAPAASTPPKPMTSTAAKPMPMKGPMKGKSAAAMRHPLHYAARHHGMGTPHEARQALAGRNQAVNAQDAGTDRLNDQSLASARGGTAMSAPMSGSMPGSMSGGAMPMGGSTGARLLRNGPGGDRMHQPPANQGASVSTNH